MIRVNSEPIATDLNFISSLEQFTLWVLERACSDSTSAKVHHKSTGLIRAESFSLKVVLDDLVVKLL